MITTADVEPKAPAVRARAVTYLRVSTRDQATRGGEAEGFSIPAQREACIRKADALGADVVAEFVDAGESARSANRPNLKKMLAMVQRDDVDYVIVHKVDRLARNRADDVEINLTLTAAGAQLVSCTENIDETPSGMLLHGIMSSIAEFYSRNLATEAKKGMRQKAKNGGTPGMAPFGYLNTSERTPEGREVRTVTLDPDRAEWVRWIFERYATGEWTFAMIRDELERRGVNSLPRPKRPAAPLATSHISSILKNRYYVGAITFEGVEYRGRHQPLVSEELFDRCQRIREGRVQSREKPRLRTHYLKGSVYCGNCGEPLSIQTSRGRLGTYYDYFYCLGRQARKNGCTFVATSQDTVEALVEQYWATIQLTENALTEIRRKVWEHFEAVLPERDRERQDAERRLASFQRESDKLLQAFYADAIDVDHLRVEQARIAAAKAAAERQLGQVTVALERIEDAFERCCALLADAQRHYRESDPNGRRDLNQGVFTALYIVDHEIVGADFTPVFRHLLADDLAERLRVERPRRQSPHVRTSNLFLVTSTPSDPTPAAVHPSGVLRSQLQHTQQAFDRPDRRARPHGPLPWEHARTLVQQDQGSNVTILVGVTGFEPAASSSRTKRATKLRHTPVEPAQDSGEAGVRRNRPGDGEGAVRHTRRRGGERAVSERRTERVRSAQPSARGTSVSRLASGRHAKRTGAYGEVPMPAETLSHRDPSPPGEPGRGPGQPCSPRARPRSRSQLVTSAP
jgi:site-specific DNA recombinase